MSAADATGPDAGDAGAPLLLNQPVVIDNGTATIKAGFAGSSKPKVCRDSVCRVAVAVAVCTAASCKGHLPCRVCIDLCVSLSHTLVSFSVFH
jgi:hypothetical protein